jgi:hypothetical protein
MILSDENTPSKANGEIEPNNTKYNFLLLNIGILFFDIPNGVGRLTVTGCSTVNRRDFKKASVTST